VWIFLIIHTIKPGDTIYSLAKKYDTTVQKIIADNSLENTERLMPGQSIVINVESVKYKAEHGDSLYSIAKKYGTTVFHILASNPEITDPSKISIGQEILITFPRKKLGTIEVNGYAFPNIDINTLENTLPHLTYLSIFSYQVRADGSLVSINDSELTTLARQYKTASLMVVTNIKEGGSFDSELAHTILSDENIQNKLLDNIVKVLNDKRYHGLNIDFEYLYPRDKENYNKFLKKAVDKLRPLGYSVSTAVAPKTSADQKGLLYEAHDYQAHGKILDHVIIMTYEWGYTFGPPLPVAPYNLVEEVIQYAVKEIPSNKILMGIPNYGYDWTLPFVKGTAARSISNTEAIKLASEVGAQIKFDERAKSPYFNYFDKNRKQHIVWFEDARSIEAKLTLVEKYNLGGVSYWTINTFFPQNWVVLESMYNVKKIY
jgi:spore germination protein